jgi:signal transduction histidine kinase
MTKKVALLTLVLIGVAAAATRGTPQEAKAMLAKAVAHYKSVGRAQAMRDFNAGKAPFRDRDLYVFCIAPDALTVANGGFPQYVGTSVNTLKDAEGKPLGKRLMESVATGNGSVEYMWLNPVTKKTEWKVSYTARVGTDVCGVGAYEAR